MSELINNQRKRIDDLKSLILEMHKGRAVEETKLKLTELLGSIPYGDVVRAEEELIEEGLDREEILKFCDLHTDALKGNIDLSFAKQVPAGHPVDTFINENKEIQKIIDKIKQIFHRVPKINPTQNAQDLLTEIHENFNLLMDIDKHYLRKENLLFPFLEKHQITGPPMVMWGKHDETREFLKSCFALFNHDEEVTAEVLSGFIEFAFAPAIKSIEGMIYKEENILFPMCMDTLTEIEWFDIYLQSEEIGYCLYAPNQKWTPPFSVEAFHKKDSSDKIKFENGSLSQEELEGIFNNIPIDLTFVDKDDKVKFFSHGTDRIFQRPKAVLGRQVQYCHPPSSVHIVNQIVDDFKAGRQNSAKFWINFQNKFVYIAYYAIRSINGEYLGTLEVTHDINEYRKIEGERRILQYDK
jgi:DUF438 domain-containing protein